MTTCDSCGMPLESAADHALGDAENSHCKHCAPDGVLQPFEERFERMAVDCSQRRCRSRGRRVAYS
jgi:hypothetical protein